MKHLLGWLLVSLAIVCAPQVAEAQVAYSGTALVHDFSSYRGLGLAPGGASGALDSRAWFTNSGVGSCALSGTCPAAAPPTTPTGPFYGGASTGGVTVASLYAFDVGGVLGGNPALGVQPSPTTYTPGTLTAAYTNGTGAPITAIRVGYVFWENNDTVGAIGLGVALDPDGPGAASPVAIAALEDQTPAPIGIIGGWQSRIHTAIVDLSATPIAAGARFDVIFTVRDIPGSSIPTVYDEIAIDDVTIAPVPIVGACGDGTVQPGEQCDPGPSGSSCCTAMCTFAVTGTMCGGAPSGTCDAQDTCNGAGVCVPRFAASTVVCRASRGVCDVVERCTGTSSACPVDRIQPSTFVCRAAVAGGCDVAENCTGSDDACPPNEVVPNGTSCANAMICDGSEVCMAGTCRPGTPLACNDGDACTTDMCAEPSGCGAVAIPGCCNNASECDDGDVCTADACSGVGGTCSNSAITGCCVSNADCDDANVCTTNTCDLSTNRCMVEAVPDCCGSAADCDDGNACTTDTCSSGGACGNEAIAGCCLTDGDCDDGDDCTADACADNLCASTPILGCGIDGGVPDAGVDGGSPPDAGLPPDGGPRDGGVPIDGSLEDGGVIGVDAGGPGVSGGCGCRAQGQRSSLGGLGVLALLALAIGRRARR